MHLIQMEMFRSWREYMTKGHNVSITQRSDRNDRDKNLWAADYDFWRKAKSEFTSIVLLVNLCLCFQVCSF